MIVDKKNPKVIGITAVMNNPQLARVVTEAMQSPPGSTKRINAMAVLRSINKMNGGYAMDGQGGISVAPVLQQPTLSVKKPVQQPNLSVTSQPIQQPSISVQPSAGQQQPTQSAGQAIQGGMQPGVQGVAPAGRFIFPAASQKNENALPLPSESLISRDSSGIDFTSWYDKLPDETKEKYKPVYEAVEAGVGSKTFAWQMLDDVNKLKQIPGFENLPSDALPTGASLARQVADLQNTLKEEFQINQKQDNLKKLSERGISIEDTLQDYINGRDEYLNRINTMIDSAKSSMIDMDLANPYVSSKANQYMNYLYILKGRQNKRYANFLDSAIRQHNFELTRAQNDYDSTYKRFEDELNRKKTIAEEDYNRLNTMLQEMYNNVESREKKEYDMGILEQQYIKAVKENAKIGLDILTPNDVDEINTFERIIGKKLPDEIWNYIYLYVPSSTSRSSLLRALQNVLKSSPNMSSNEITSFVNDWLTSQESVKYLIDHSTGEKIFISD